MEKAEAGISELKLEYFLLDDRIYHISRIEELRLDGGINGFGCWGDIKLFGQPEMVIGDGSYYGDGKHVRHKQSQSFNFLELRQIMKQLCPKIDERKS